MVRKRVILLGLTLGLIVNQFMLWQCNKVISAPNYSYTNADSGYNVAPTGYNNISREYSYDTNNEKQYVSTVQRPEWYEFCPLEFENPQYIKVPFRNKSFDHKYWYQRKQNFEYNLQQCDNKNGKYRDICYTKLRAQENELSNNWIPMQVRMQQQVERNQQAQREEMIINAITRPQQVFVNHSGTINHNINGYYRY